jgi:hypothetical protein
MVGRARSERIGDRPCPSGRGARSTRTPYQRSSPIPPRAVRYARRGLAAWAIASVIERLRRPPSPRDSPPPRLAPPRPPRCRAPAMIAPGAREVRADAPIGRDGAVAGRSARSLGVVGEPDSREAAAISIPCATMFAWPREHDAPLRADRLGQCDGEPHDGVAGGDRQVRHPDDQACVRRLDDTAARGLEGGAAAARDPSSSSRATATSRGWRRGCGSRG